MPSLINHSDQGTLLVTGKPAIMRVHPRSRHRRFKSLVHIPPPIPHTHVYESVRSNAQ